MTSVILDKTELTEAFLEYHADLYSFSVTGDLRIIYRIEKDTAILIDIGTHNQVY